LLCGRCRIADCKEKSRKHQDGSGPVDVEIEELDRRADHTGEQHAPNIQRAAFFVIAVIMEGWAPQEGATR
jgi:hypothetical protein